MKHAKFGKLPCGKRLKHIENSPNYKDGKFRNKIEKPVITEGYSIWNLGWEAMTKKYPRTEPSDILPSVKTNLKNIPKEKNILIWFGHSSFYMQIDGVRFLVDPVFSGHASPFAYSVRAYKGADVYHAEDMPEIDYLLISHDHYDHLDYETIKALCKKIKHVVCGLGVGASLEHWGYAPTKILEKDWGEQVKIKENFFIYTERTQHTSGRGLIQRKTLWLAFFIEAPSLKIYYSGDGGRDDRFAEIHQKYAPIDWAIMENGQYNEAWEYVHQLPGQLIQSVKELNPKNLFTVHHSKFTLAKHPWDEPLKKIAENSINQSWKLATPMIGEIVDLNNNKQEFTKWWETVH